MRNKAPAASPPQSEPPAQDNGQQSTLPKLVLADPDPEVRAAQIQKNQAALRLLEKWMADESGYDERVGPIVERLLAENPLRF